MWDDLFFRHRAITKFLAENRNRFGHLKRYQELEIGWGLTLFLWRYHKKEYCIGYPIPIDTSMDKLTLTPECIIKHNLAIDRDIDLVLVPVEREGSEIILKETERLYLQIFRFAGKEYPATSEGFLDFMIDKKFNVPIDRHLILLCRLERGLILNYQWLYEKLQTMTVPYGKIILITGKKDSAGLIELWYFQIYPILETAKIDFDFRKENRN